MMNLKILKTTLRGKIVWYTIQNEMIELDKVYINELIKKKVYICNGSSCMTAGTQSKVHDQISKHFAAEEIGEMCCLGRCHENSSFNFDGRNYSGNAIEKIEDIKAGKDKPLDHYHVESIGSGLLTEAFTDIDTFYQILKRTW